MYEEFDHEILLFLQKTIRSLTFEFKLKYTILYDVIAEYQFQEKIFDESYDRTQSNDNIADRVKRVMRERVMANPDETTPSNPDPYRKPKLYDDIMKDMQMILYNNVIPLLGFQQIKHVYSDEFWEKVHQIGDSSEMDKDALAIIAPYAFIGERTGINFLELIFLSAITLSNKRSEKPKHRGESGFEEYALRQFRNIKEPLFSNELYESLIMTFTYALCQEILKKYDEIRIPFLREYLLPPKYQNRKDAETALRTHLEKIRNPSYFKETVSDSEESEISIILTKENAYNFLDQFKILAITEFMEKTIPLTERLLFGSTMKQNKDGLYTFDLYQDASIYKSQKQQIKNIAVSPYIYNTANKVADIVRKYVTLSVVLAGEMLSSLEEADIVEKGCILRFFSTI